MSLETRDDTLTCVKLGFENKKCALVTEAFAPGHRHPVPFQHGGVESIKILDDCGILFLLGPHVFPVDWEVFN